MVVTVIVVILMMVIVMVVTVMVVTVIVVILMMVVVMAVTVIVTMKMQTMPAGVHVHRSLTSDDLAALTLKKGVAVAAEALCGLGELLHELRDLGGGVDGALDGDDLGEGHVLQVARYDSGCVSHAARCPQVTSGHLRVHIR